MLYDKVKLTLEIEKYDENKLRKNKCMMFFFISISGLLLGWKKHSNGIILPKSYQGTSTELKDWLPIDSLHKKHF